MRVLLGIALILTLGTFVWSDWPGEGPGSRWRGNLGLLHCGGNGNYAPNSCIFGHPDNTGFMLNVGDPGSRGGQTIVGATFGTPIGQAFVNMYAAHGFSAGSTAYSGNDDLIAIIANAGTSSSSLLMQHNNAGSIVTDFRINANFSGLNITQMDLEGHDLDINNAGTNNDIIQGTTGILTKYNGITGDTSQHGMGYFVWKATATGQSGNLSSQAFSPAITSATAGRYRMCYDINITTAAGTSSTLPDAFLTFVDPVDSVTKNVQIAPSGNSSNLTSQGAGGCLIGNVAAA